MNYLQLCQRLASEVGIASGPSAVTGQTGELLRAVNWVNDAWRDIQLRHDNWQWMRAGFTITCVGGTHTYTATDAGLTDFARWDTQHIRVYTTSTADEYELTHVPYDDFRKVYMMGSIPSGKPAYYTVTPDSSLRFYPTPDFAHTIYGDYYKAPTELTADTDTPAMSSRWHIMIVYGAMMKYGVFEAAAEIYQAGEKEYRRLMLHLEREELPETGEPEPLV